MKGVIVCFCLNILRREMPRSLLFFENYFKRNHIVVSEDYAKVCHEKYCRTQKVVSDKIPKSNVDFQC